MVCAGFPFLNRRFTGIEIARKNRLADAKTLPKFLDLFQFERRRRADTGCVETPHGRLVDRTHFV